MSKHWFVKKLKPICDQRGRLMELRRIDWEECQYPIQQAYMTTAYPGVTKAWHLHRHQSDFMAIIHGMMMVGLYDDASGQTEKIFAGTHNPVLIKIQPNIWHGFKNIGTEEAIVINCPDQLYNYDNPDEFRAPAHELIEGFWDKHDG